MSESDTETPPFVHFKTPALAAPTPVDIYQLALDFTSRIFTIIELAQTERFHLKDQLDRRSTVIALLVAQARDTASGAPRRALYEQARKAAMDCRAILDIVSQRATVEASVMAPAREIVAELLDRLGRLATR